MNLWCWLFVLFVGLSGAVCMFVLWASCAVAKQADEWMQHFDDEWEVGG